MRITNRTTCIILAILVVLLAFTGCAGMGRNNAGNPTGDARDRIGNIEDRVGTPQGFNLTATTLRGTGCLTSDVNDGDINDRDTNGGMGGQGGTGTEYEHCKTTGYEN